MDSAALHYAGGLLLDHLAPLRMHLEDPTVQEIEINTGSEIWVERQGTTSHDPTICLEEVAICGAIDTLANINGKPATRILDCRLPGLRVAAARHPVAIRGSSMCIRKHACTGIRLEDYLQRGLFDVLAANTVAGGQPSPERPSDTELKAGGQALLRFLVWLVVSKKNVIVTGSTSSGKTTLLNAMLAEIPADQRLITIEDTAELMVSVPNHVGFEADNREVFIRDLVRLALRYAPKRIVVGEIRGAESYDLIAALNTGHQGGFVTFHANAAHEALPRLEGMLRQSEEGKTWPLDDIRVQIANTFDFIIHAAHEHGVRAPMEVRALLGARDGVYQTRLLFSKVIREDQFYV